MMNKVEFLMDSAMGVETESNDFYLGAYDTELDGYEKVKSGVYAKVEGDCMSYVTLLVNGSSMYAVLAAVLEELNLTTYRKLEWFEDVDTSGLLVELREYLEYVADLVGDDFESVHDVNLVDEFKELSNHPDHNYRMFSKVEDFINVISGGQLSVSDFEYKITVDWNEYFLNEEDGILVFDEDFIDEYKTYQLRG